MGANTLPLWLESAAPPATYTDDKAQTVFKGHQIAPLKHAVLDIFTDGKGLVNLEHLGLYACASTQAEGVENAIKTLGNADGSVDRDTLLSILSLASLSCFEASSAAEDAALV